MADFSWIGPLVSAVGQGINSAGANNSATDDYLAAYEQMLANLQARFGDYDKLGKAGYQDIEAQQVGPSALEGIQLDPRAQLEQEAALAALSDLSDRGGLSLGDMKALNDIQGNLNRNTLARRKGLANDFAARGQLGSGAQLAMDMQAQSDAAMNANQRGESIAAQAQDRAMQAILEKGRMARSMGDDSWRRQAMAAQARDAIEARNAAARTDAGKYNNTIRGQAFEDELSKARGKTSLTNSINEAVFGQGQTKANRTLANANLTNAAIGAGGDAFASWASDDDGKGDLPPADNTPDYGEDEEP